MKYTIVINQRAIIDSGLELDMKDAAILDLFLHWMGNSAADRVIVDGKEYVWIGYNLIQDQLPIIKLGNKDTVYRRLKELCDMGLLEACPANQRLGRSYYRMGKLASSIHFDDADIDAPPADRPVKEPKESVERKVLFRNSKYADIALFCDHYKSAGIYDSVDIEHYYHAVMDYSDRKDVKRTDRGWIATANTFMRINKQENKLVTRKGSGGVQSAIDFMKL